MSDRNPVSGTTNVGDSVGLTEGFTEEGCAVGLIRDQILDWKILHLRVDRINMKCQIDWVG